MSANQKEEQKYQPAETVVISKVSQPEIRNLLHQLIRAVVMSKCNASLPGDASHNASESGEAS
jgi:hypothetical protein